MKNTRDREEYRRAYAIKQKIEGIPYRTIAKGMNVNYRSVYDWIYNYRKDGLDGIRNKRKNGGRRTVISTTKNKEMIRDIVLNQSPTTFGYLVVVRPDIGDIIAYRHGLHFYCCKEVNPYRNQK